MIHARGPEIVVGIAIVSDRGVVRSHVNGVCGDGHWLCKIDLLPAGSSLSRESCRRQQRAAARPQIAHVCAGVARALVKANAGNGAVRVSLKANSYLDGRVGSRIRYRG